MYLYIGQDTLINSADILGIFDSDTSTVSEVSRATLKQAQGEGRLISVCDKLPKSYVLACRGGENVIYMSPFSPKILKKRLNESII